MIPIYEAQRSELWTSMTAISQGNVQPVVCTNTYSVTIFVSNYIYCSVSGKFSVISWSFFLLSPSPNFLHKKWKCLANKSSLFEVHVHGMKKYSLCVVFVCVYDRDKAFGECLKPANTVGTNNEASRLCLEMCPFFLPVSFDLIKRCVVSGLQNCNNTFFMHHSFPNSWLASKANSYAVINLALQSCQHRGNLNDIKERMWETELRNAQVIHWKLKEDLRIHLFINPETAVNKCVSGMSQRKWNTALFY